LRLQNWPILQTGLWYHSRACKPFWLHEHQLVPTTTGPSLFYTAVVYIAPCWNFNGLSTSILCLCVNSFSCALLRVHYYYICSTVFTSYLVVHSKCETGSGGWLVQQSRQWDGSEAGSCYKKVLTWWV
jgi:hypothetical protein